MDRIKHKDDCLPWMRKTEILMPIAGMKCSNCGEKTPQTLFRKQQIKEEFEKFNFMFLSRREIMEIIDRM